MPLPHRCYCLHNFCYGDGGYSHRDYGYYVFRRHKWLPSCTLYARSIGAVSLKGASVLDAGATTGLKVFSQILGADMGGGAIRQTAAGMLG